VPDAPLSIAQVCPRGRTAAGGRVEDFVQRASVELARRGHEVLRIGTGDPVKRLLKARPIDIVHVHEPFAPSVASAALRHSHSLNVASFHAPKERVLSTQVARPLVEIFFGRIDARTVTSPETARLLESYFPADYELLEGAGEGREWSTVADELEKLYRRLLARRHTEGGDPELRARIAERPLIEVDLHMHTDHSTDCATPVDVLLRTARDRGLGAIAITDHNEVSGALEAREIAAEMGDIKVIVAEEVKTAEQGEVIGLFLEEKIPKGLTMAETIAAIRAQNGLVYVPHPFDRFHTTPEEALLLEHVASVDVLETANARLWLERDNRRAERFASEHGLRRGAGSDAHVPEGIGTAALRLATFDDPVSFLAALEDAEIVREPRSMVRLQVAKRRRQRSR
jgi:predicted metal-dependent phosphoesterase TrpH